MNFSEAKEEANNHRNLIGQKLDDGFGIINYVIPVPFEEKDLSSFIEMFISTENVDVSAKPFLNKEFTVVVLPNLSDLKNKGILVWRLLSEALKHINNH